MLGSRVSPGDARVIFEIRPARGCADTGRQQHRFPPQCGGEMSMHPVDAMKTWCAGVNVEMTPEAENELRAICDEPVDVPAGAVRPAIGGGFTVFLPGWYRTTKDHVSHLFEAFGDRSVRGACGHIVLAASMVVENPNNTRCAECRRISKRESV